MAEQNQKNRQKHQKLLVTGMTPDTAKRRLKPGDEAPEEALACYLCGRTKGELHFLVDITDEEPAQVTPSIKLEQYRIRVSKDLELIYMMCAHCSVLLEGLVKGKLKRV